MTSIYLCGWVPQGFHSGLGVKASACNAGDPVLTPGLGRSPGEGHGNPLQDSCLDRPVDRGAWRATVHGGGGHKESDMTALVGLLVESPQGWGHGLGWGSAAPPGSAGHCLHGSTFSAAPCVGDGLALRPLMSGAPNAV